MSSQKDGLMFDDNTSDDALDKLLSEVTHIEPSNSLDTAQTVASSTTTEKNIPPLPKNPLVANKVLMEVSAQTIDRKSTSSMIKKPNPLAETRHKPTISVIDLRELKGGSKSSQQDSSSIKNLAKPDGQSLLKRISIGDLKQLSTNQEAKQTTLDYTLPTQPSVVMTDHDKVDVADIHENQNLETVLDTQNVSEPLNHLIMDQTEQIINEAQIDTPMAEIDNATDQQPTNMLTIPTDSENTINTEPSEAESDTPKITPVSRELSNKFMQLFSQTDTVNDSIAPTSNIEDVENLEKHDILESKNDLNDGENVLDDNLTNSLTLENSADVQENFANPVMDDPSLPQEIAVENQDSWTDDNQNQPITDSPKVLPISQPIEVVDDSVDIEVVATLEDLVNDKNLPNTEPANQPSVLLDENIDNIGMQLDAFLMENAQSAEKTAQNFDHITDDLGLANDIANTENPVMDDIQQTTTDDTVITPSIHDELLENHQDDQTDTLDDNLSTVSTDLSKTDDLNHVTTDDQNTDIDDFDKLMESIDTISEDQTTVDDGQTDQNHHHTSHTEIVTENTATEILISDDNEDFINALTKKQTDTAEIDTTENDINFDTNFTAVIHTPADQAESKPNFYQSSDPVIKTEDIKKSDNSTSDDVTKTANDNTDQETSSERLLDKLIKEKRQAKQGKPDTSVFERLYSASYKPTSSLENTETPSSKETLTVDKQMSDSKKEGVSAMTSPSQTTTESTIFVTNKGKSVMNHNTVLEIEQLVDTLKNQLHDINAQFFNTNDTSAKLFSKLRELQAENQGKYQNTYQKTQDLRNHLVAARKSFNELTSLVDLMETALEDDLYANQK